MLYFENDYCEGAHPAILQKLAETNFEKVSGYGTDPYCASAKAKICAACGCPDADVTFISGGTQTNAIVIASMLQRWQGVMAAATGHVAAHEAGAIEYTGHKVIALPGHEGKVSASDVRDWCATFYADDNHDHMVFPGMVYISHPSEYGTLYSKEELEELHAVCQEYHMPLFMDGARLGYGLMAKGTDVTLADIARLTDVFYIGGTKVGALCGEAVVFPHGAPAHFMTMVKQQGALLAKGRYSRAMLPSGSRTAMAMPVGDFIITPSMTAWPPTVHFFILVRRSFPARWTCAYQTILYYSIEAPRCMPRNVKMYGDTAFVSILLAR